VLAGTLSYAFAGSWARAQLTGVPPLVSATGMLTASSALLVPLALVLDGPPSLALPASAWGAIAYYALAATAFAYLLYYRVLAMAGAGNLLICTLLIPPVAIVLGTVVRGEALLPQAYAGFALLGLGLAILDGRPLAWIGRRFSV
jgi:drug/metabolite transporter (DMT)-like permease